MSVVLSRQAKKRREGFVGKKEEGDLGCLRKGKA